ncbi:MAG: DsbA family protein [Candidatus Nomurabacteria bacterium]|jgi:protein-disulfide isomerase|nr:DsbA family protein [Candidatus Nomurabacteria bacterium]
MVVNTGKVRYLARFVMGGMIVVMLVLFAIAILAGTLQSKTPTAFDEPKPSTSLDDKSLEDTSLNSEHRYGDPGAKAIITIFGDFQCPYTVSGMSYLKAVVSEYPKGVVLVYRHFPLESIHPNARYAASATEAAALQGKYWPMSSLIFAEREAWSNLDYDQLATAFKGYAKTLELDIEKYERDIVSNGVRDKVNKDLALAEKYGLNGTPSVFLNGAKVDLEVVYDTNTFIGMIDAAIAK